MRLERYNLIVRLLSNFINELKMTHTHTQESLMNVIAIGLCKVHTDHNLTIDEVRYVLNTPLSNFYSERLLKDLS